MAEIFRSWSDALNILGPGLLGNGIFLLLHCLILDGNELAVITLMTLNREHPCQCDDDEDETGPKDDEDLAEIEGVLLDAAVDMVIALAKVLKEQFSSEFGPFYRRLLKNTKSKNQTERAMAVAGLGEITGALKGSVSKHTGELLEMFMVAIDDSAVDVAANAIYGLGLL